MSLPSARTRIAAVTGAVALTGVLVACGSEKVSVAQKDPNRAGAVLFNQRCSGCHTLNSAGAEGSATRIVGRERVDGPNFNVRKETKDQVLYALRNGGFSGAIMPENILVGQDAEKVAAFLAKYSGVQAKKPPTSNG